MSQQQQHKHKRKGQKEHGGQQQQQQQKGRGQQQQQQQLSKQEKMMMEMNTLYELSQAEALDQPAGPLEVLFSAVPAILGSVFLVSAASRLYFSEEKPISKQKLITVLSEAYKIWASTVADLSRQENAVFQQNPDMTPEQKKGLTEYFRMQAMQQLGQTEDQLLQQANCTRAQIQSATRLYENDKQVAKVTQDLNKIVNNIVPPPPLPYPWKEADVISILSELFELRIATMEEAYKSLELDQRPKGVPLTPQMAEDLNQLFSESLSRRLAEFYSGKGVTSQFFQKLIRSVQSSPNYLDLVHTFRQEQQQRYAAIGLEIKKR